jgi:hypothetical protein
MPIVNSGPTLKEGCVITLTHLLAAVASRIVVPIIERF